MNIRKTLSELTRYRFTLVIIPHTAVKIRKITFSFNFIVFLLLLWTGLTAWVTYTNVKYTKYVGGKLECKLLEKRFQILAKQEKKYREFLEEVRTRDGNVRKIIELADNNESREDGVYGGPDSSDESYLDKSLGHKVYELRSQELRYRIKTLNKELCERLNSAKEINKNIQHQKMVYTATPNILPCKGHFSKNYGYRIHPITGAYEFHKGIDISNKRGTPIYATADGVVVHADWSGGYGRLVVIDHGYGYQTRYAHLFKILVSLGEKVKRSRKIGLMGDTGTSTCNHLHYEVRYCNTPLNPFIFLKKDVYFSLRK